MARLGAAAVVALALAGTAAASPLDDALARIAAGSGTTLGVYVEHLERHETAGVAATRPFPMASTFKLPLAVVVLRAIERHALPPLDATVRMLPTDMFPSASPLWERMPNGGAVTMRELLTQMLEVSDNSAADVLLRLAGGPARVTAALRALGVDGMSIDRGEAEMALDSHGVAHPPPAEWTAARLRALLDAAPRAQHQAALLRFAADPRDHATPAAMGRLLARVWRGELLGAASRAFLMQELTRCRVGTRRLRAGLPAGTKVADRTGTCDGLGADGADCANAVGVVTLPSGEHVVMAVYVADGGGPAAAKEKRIAAVARAVWAHYTRAK